MSEVSFGSWLTLGSRVELRGTRELVRAAFDLGVNLFDTADVYANGRAEQALGEAIADLPRSALVLATKCFFPVSDRPNDRGLSRKHIVESVEASLRRLRTDYLDLHQCHRPDPETPIEETARAYDDLIRQGKLLYWGTSEWRPAQIVDACRIADRRDGAAPISNQPEYSLLQRRIEHEVIPVCAREGIGQIVWSPLAQGVLTGKYAGGARPAGSRATDEERGGFMQRFLAPETLARVDAMRPIAAELGVSMARLALGFCLRQPNVSSVIIGATRVEQLEDDVAASGLAIPDEIAAKLDALFPARAS